MYRRAPMSWTHVAEQPHADLDGCDDGRRLSAVAGPFTADRAPRSAPRCGTVSRPCHGQETVAQRVETVAQQVSGAAASRTIIRPTLHHFGLTTANLEAMVDWYAKVLDLAPNHRPSTPVGAQAVSGWRTVWVSNDQANHRIAIMALPGLTDDAQRSRHKGLHHVAFEYE